MLHLQALLLLASTHLTLGALRSSLGPIVDLGYAAYIGNSTSPTGQVNSSVTFFGGLPYAQPPIGNLRFRAPQPLNARNANKDKRPVVEARNWASSCIQQLPEAGVGSEDCLKINVWKPTNASAGDGLPVIVYIHGGGFFDGNPQGFPLYDWVAQHPTGIIAASLAYRLNVLGFLSGSAVEKGNLNAGLLDQRLALEWVQKHISKFGGDSKKVTIIGESSGAASVIMHLTSFGGSKPAPFIRAVAHSIGYGPTPNSEQSEKSFAQVASYAGCPTSGPSAIACLRNAPLDSLVVAMKNSAPGQFSPVVDGASGILPDLPSRLLANGRFASGVEFVGGHCTHEGRTFVGELFTGATPEQFVTDDDVRRLVFGRWPGVSNTTIDKASALYPLPNATGSPFATQYDRAWNMAGDIIFTCMDWYAAEQTFKKGTKNVYTFRWNSPDAVLYNATPYLGVMHTSDLYFFFDGTNTAANAGSTFTPFNTTEKALASEAIAYWTSIVDNGDPSSSKLASSPKWIPFATGNGSSGRQKLVLTQNVDGINGGAGGVIKSASGMEAWSDFEIERCKFWMSEDVTRETAI